MIPVINIYFLDKKSVRITQQGIIGYTKQRHTEHIHASDESIPSVEKIKLSTARFQFRYTQPPNINKNQGQTCNFV